MISRSDYGEITFREWHPVGVFEYGYIAVDPQDSNMVYGARLTRTNQELGEVADNPCRADRMEEIAISQFKAKCLAILQRVKKTGKPVRVTRFGQVIAEVYPPPGLGRVPRLGTGRGSVHILGDILGPISDESEWEAARTGPQNDASK